MGNMNLPPQIRQQLLDGAGNPISGGMIYTYQSGTTTPQATYTDQSGVTPNANPVVADSSGVYSMWLDPSLSYKFVMKDASGNTLETVDNVVGLLTVNAVNTASIQDSAVTTAKLNANSVTSNILASDASVDANRAVQTNHIRDAQVTKPKLASNAKDLNVVSETATYAVLSSDDLILCDATSAAFTVTLPTASGIQGHVVRIKKTDSTFNLVTLATTSSQTIDGVTTRKIATQNEQLVVCSDGTNWQIIERRIPSGVTITTTTITGITTNPTKGTVSADRFEWSRVGDKMFIHVQYVQTAAGVAGSGTYLFTIPNSLQIDTSKTNVSSSAVNNVGRGKISNNSGSQGPSTIPIHIVPYNSTSLAIEYTDASSSDLLTDTGYVSSSTYGLGSTNLTITFNAIVPISGWEG